MTSQSLISLKSEELKDYIYKLQNFIKDEKQNVSDYIKTYGDVEVSSFRRVSLG